MNNPERWRRSPNAGSGLERLCNVCDQWVDWGTCSPIGCVQDEIGLYELRNCPTCKGTMSLVVVPGALPTCDGCGKQCECTEADGRELCAECIPKDPTHEECSDCKALVHCNDVRVWAAMRVCPDCLKRYEATYRALLVRRGWWKQLEEFEDSRESNQ